MKKIIAQIACATILSMGIITNTAICADKEVKAEITQGYPNIAAEGKTLEKQIASVIKAVKTLEKKAKAFNKIAMKEFVKGDNNQSLDSNITNNRFIAIQKYFENIKKAVAAIRRFKSKSTIGAAINQTKNVDSSCLQNATEIFNGLRTIKMSDKARKAAVSFHAALDSFVKSLEPITTNIITKNTNNMGSDGQFKVANQFFENFEAKLNEMKSYNTSEFRLQPETWTNKNQNSTASTEKTKSAAKISNKAPLTAGRNRSLSVRRNSRS